MITQEYLKTILHYNDITGVFTWISPKSNRVKSGDVAGTIFQNRYKVIRLNKKNYYLHRLAWLYIYGEFPKKEIDHINNNGLDNRLENLRDVDHRKNNQNKKIHKNGRLVGATYNKIKRKWQARIKYNNLVKHIGYYNTELEAHIGHLNHINKGIN